MMYMFFADMFQEVSNRVMIKQQSVDSGGQHGVERVRNTQFLLTNISKQG